MILFETSTSVFELLWDIALTLFILRIAFVYFLLTFLSGLFLAYFRFSTLQPINHLTVPQAELVTMPFWLLLITLWARWTIVAYEVPRVRGFRIAIGGVALGFLVIAELAGGIVLYERGVTKWVWETDPLAAGMGCLVLGLFGLMPALLMVFEGETDEMGETSHGHEKKSVAAAV
ncbi:uncharacterized protein LY89DRAFT_595113 [Mollisia scopiformis]|uniref:Uncharacterized protein n=1 Tax=Mollisia scopiformis TaxID=149040 RepID=A0A194WSY3_MOLSC|nr:uncharacterized protein LY89DRAFT_595113 [Mollisia scopiformis]KUJ11063.1 hypothetical protein LY89DRAFT_595113 [Mollisia scopiformis]